MFIYFRVRMSAFQLLERDPIIHVWPTPLHQLKAGFAPYILLV
jgi:hypothetical protein